MVTVRAPRPRLSVLICAALLAGCSNDAVVAEDAGETTAMSSTAAESSDSSSSTDTTPSDTSTSTDTMTTANFIAETGPDTGVDTSAPGNLGDMCQTDADCAEDLFCNGLPGFGGLCSECASDSDCPDGGNCTISQMGWFACGDGGLGQMCESDASCAMGLHCAEVVDLGGLFNGNFCSECATDADCMNGQLCAPVIEFMDLMNIGGRRECIDPKTLPNDSICDADGNGDEQCQGFCTTADLMGFIQLGVCGECETNADCGMGMMGMCNPAMIGFEGFSGSTCG
jgi:hypothetical protein